MPRDLQEGAELDARDFSYLREPGRAAASAEGAEPGDLSMAAAAEDLADWVPDPRVYRTSAGTEVIHLHQYYRGIPVFEGMRTLHLDPDGGARQVTGDGVLLQEEITTEPELGAGDALLVAARYLAALEPGAELAVTPHRPRVLAAHALAAQPTVLGKRPFEGPVLAHLTLFNPSAGTSR